MAVEMRQVVIEMYKVASEETMEFVVRRGEPPSPTQVPNVPPYKRAGSVSGVNAPRRTVVGMCQNGFSFDPLWWIWRVKCIVAGRSNAPRTADTVDKQLSSQNRGYHGSRDNLNEQLIISGRRWNCLCVNNRDRRVS